MAALRFSILFIFCSGVFAQSITSRSVDSISYTRVRLNFVTDTLTNNDQYCVSSVSSTPPFTQCNMLSVSATSGLNHSRIVGRLTPNTLYHWYVCTGGGVVCTDGSDTFTTLSAPNPRFVMPTKPTMVTPQTDPGTYGGTYTMSACTQTELQNGLNAAGAYSGSLAYLVLVPWSTNLVCNNINAKLPARACSPNCGPVVVRPNVPSTLYLPPPGVQLHPDQSFWYSNAVTLSSSAGGDASCSSTCPAAIWTDVATSNWLFIGLKFTRSIDGYVPSLVAFQNLGATVDIHDITFDRCAFLYPGTLAPSQVSVRGITCALRNLSVLNSYMYLVNNKTFWFSVALEITGLQGGRFENNSIMAIGISVFAQTGGPPTLATRTMNIYFHRNHWWYDRTWAIPAPNSLYSRQMLEFKQGWYVWEDGDVFENEWYGGQTGAYATILALSLRADDSTTKLNGSINRLTNLTFTNITARNIPGWSLLSAQDGATNQSSVTDAAGSDNWWFENIQISGINGFDCFNSFGACSARGQLATGGGAIENLTMRHITSMAPNMGNAAYTLAWLDFRGSGLRINNNIFSVSWNDYPGGYGHGGGFYASGSSTMYPALPTNTLANSGARWNYFFSNEDGYDPANSMGPNIWFNGSEHTNDPTSYTKTTELYPTATCTSLVAQNGNNTCVGVGTTPNATLYNQNSTYVVDALNTNYSALGNSPYTGTASDGLSYGASPYKLSVAQGHVLASSIQAQPSGDVYWETRDPATICYIDTASTRTTVAGGSRFKHVTLGGPGTSYTLSCANAMDSSTYKPAVYTVVIPAH